MSDKDLVNKLKNFNIIIISIKGSHKRKDFQKNQLGNLQLNATFMDAVTPNDLTPAVLEKYSTSWARPLRKTEIALTHSHAKAWQHSIETNKPILILEDDVVLCDSLPLILQSVFLRDDLEFVQLETFGEPKLLCKMPESLCIQDYRLHKLYRDRGGSAAYIIWPKTAKKLIYSVKKTYPPADAAIHLAPGIRRHQISPACAIQAMKVPKDSIDFERVSDIAPSSVSNVSKPDYGSYTQWLMHKTCRLMISLELFKRILAATFSAEYQKVNYTGK